VFKFRQRFIDSGVMPVAFKINKKIIVPGAPFDGLDSILLRFTPYFLNGRSISCSAPTLSLIENISDVLSLPVGAVSVVPITKKRVRLLWRIFDVARKNFQAIHFCGEY